MRKFAQSIAIAALVGAVSLGCLAAAPQARAERTELADVSAVNCPVVRLNHWQASTRTEKLAFLFGLVSMLELERHWQQGQPLPIERSINQSWVKGFTGKTLGEIADALDDFAAKNPDRLEMPVLVAIGRLYVRPSLTPAERKAAGDRYEQIRGRR
jgi:hypothetical protein